jgi:hypothetical protein
VARSGDQTDLVRSFVSDEPAKDIRRVADVKAADLVLMGAGRPRDGAPLGLTAQRVMLESLRTVAVLLHPAALEKVEHVLVVVSESERDHAVLTLAARLLDGGAELTLQRGPASLGTASPADAFAAAHRRARLVVREAGGAATALTERRFDLVIAPHPEPAWLPPHAGEISLLLVCSGAAAESRRASA